MTMLSAPSRSRAAAERGKCDRVVQLAVLGRAQITRHPKINQEIRAQPKEAIRDKPAAIAKGGLEFVSSGQLGSEEFGEEPEPGQFA